MHFLQNDLNNDLNNAKTNTMTIGNWIKLLYKYLFYNVPKYIELNKSIFVQKGWSIDLHRASTIF